MTIPSGTMWSIGKNRIGYKQQIRFIEFTFQVSDMSLPTKSAVEQKESHTLWHSVRCGTPGKSDLTFQLSNDKFLALMKGQ